MTQVVVSPDGSGEFITIRDALKAGSPDELHILVRPGNYPEDSLRVWGHVALTAVAGPGTVTVDVRGGAAFTAEGSLTLDGLTVRNWDNEGAVIKVPGGTLGARACTFVSRSKLAIDAWAGSDTLLDGCRVEGGAVVYAASKGRVAATTIDATAMNAVACCAGSRVTLSSCDITKPGLHGIWVTEGSELLAEGCRIRDPAGAAIALADRATMVVRSSRLVGSGQCCLVVRGNGSALIEDCAVTNAGEHGIMLTDGGEATLHRTQVGGAEETGLWINDGARGEVVDCDIVRSGRGGVWVDSRRRPSVFQGGTVTDCGRGKPYGFGVLVRREALARFHSMSIAHNTNIGLGIEIGAEAGTEVLLRDCTVSDTDGVGVAGVDLPGVRLENLTAERNTGGDRQGAGTRGILEEPVRDTAEKSGNRPDDGAAAAHNMMSGTAYGAVVQAGTIREVHIHPPRNE